MVALIEKMTTTFFIPFYFHQIDKVWQNNGFKQMHVFLVPGH